MPDNAIGVAFSIDSSGRAEAIDRSTLSRWSTDSGFIWIHLDRTDADSADFLQSASLLDPFMVEALLPKKRGHASCEKATGLSRISES